MAEVLQGGNVSSRTSCPSCIEGSPSRSSGIIPGIVAAAIFITFLLSLYAVLWRCMTSPRQRKRSKARARMKKSSPV
ncbi:hypothetical protein OJAV_G00086800 [Oryzias javanicus]|uniref:Uncharacterized protein n=1 Tax=Oryzias javanicus TaxID=123683 RepID=A0A3S2M4S9_ORYJA|nr:hypothetical protein OJAV_G00086800 [Oryzias javanicus]